MKTALGFVPADEHLELGHPESPGRLCAITDLLESRQELADFSILDPVAADYEQLARVHDPRLINLVKEAASQGDGHLDADTYVTAASYMQACLAAGTTCFLVDAVAEKRAENAFALVRPPGHHAEKSRVGGFCLFNNIAVAARHVQQIHGVERVLIIDIDVHHGNGTQEIFYTDQNVLFVSMHLFHPFFYPGSGSAEEIGYGPGQGATLNVPLSAGAGDVAYGRVLREVIIPISKRFGPEFILVSAGFDAHWIDPLASAGLSLGGYSEIASLIVDFANQACDGRCVFVLEGGYHREALSFGVINILKALGKSDEVIDPLGPSPYSEPEIDPLIKQLHALHLLS